MKARNKKTGKIVEYTSYKTAKDDLIVVDDGTGECFYTIDNFDESYEPISDETIKAHYTCIHSDKYNYSCGECIKNFIKQELDRIVEEVEKQKLRCESDASMRETCNDIINIIKKQ